MTDSIERDITIDATLDRVWDLVTEPGWWVPSDTPATADREPGAVTVRESRQYGRFPVQVIRLDPQDYAAFRWASQFPGEDLTDGRTTLIEFFLEPRGDSVRVRVVESGFASLAAPESVRAAGVTENGKGWIEELAALANRAQTAQQAART